MHIDWVNHASFIFSDGEISLICDPWLSGSVFNNGWELLSPSKFLGEDFARITHIWFSHEHPDHFYPPNLREIPEHYRTQITVLYHETRDKRVLKLCKGLGFRTQEMPLHQSVRISSRVQLTTGPNDLIDSWLAIRCDDYLILNLNDCVFNDAVELEDLVREIGKPSLLLTQFSYANWVGNPGDWDAHRKHAEHKRDQIRRQVEILGPQRVIPFASYVVFAHEENFGFNKEANQISDIYRFTTEGLSVTTLVLYPGDRWEIGAAHDSSSALARYTLDYAGVVQRGPVHGHKAVSLEQLRAAQVSYFRKMKARHWSVVLRLIPACTAYVRDLGVSVKLSFRDGLTVSDVSSEKTDIVLSADSLRYCYLHDWGGDTLAVNGRYEVPEGGHPDRFFWNFRPGMYSASGVRLGYRFLLSQVAKRGLQILKRGLE